MWVLPFSAPATLYRNYSSDFIHQRSYQKPLQTLVTILALPRLLITPFYLNFSFVLTLGTFYFLNWPPLLKVLYCNVIKPPTSIYQTSILDLFFFPQLSLSWVISLIATSMSFQVNPKAPSLFLPFSRTPSLFLT